MPSVSPQTVPDGYRLNPLLSEAGFSTRAEAELARRDKWSS